MPTDVKLVDADEINIETKINDYGVIKETTHTLKSTGEFFTIYAYPGCNIIVPCESRNPSKLAIQMHLYGITCEARVLSPTFAGLTFTHHDCSTMTVEEILQLLLREHPTEFGFIKAQED